MYHIYILGLCLCLVGFIYEKINKKKSKWLYFLILFCCAVVMANGDATDYDLLNYKRSYRNIAAGADAEGFYIGFYYVQKYAIALGLDFDQFRLILYIVGMFLIYITISRYTNHIYYFFLFYMLHSLVMDTMQIRNFISIAVVIFAIPYLFKKGKNNLIIYCICVLIATTLHTMAIVYFLFILIKLDGQILKWLIRLTPLFFIVLFLAMRFGMINGVLDFLISMGSDFVFDKYNLYSQATTRYGFLVPMTIYFLFVVSIIYLNRTIEENYLTEYKSFSLSNNLILSRRNIFRDNRVFFKYIEYINYIGLFLLLLCVMNVVYYRLVRNICLMNWIYMAVMYDAANTKKRRFMILFLSVILLVGWRIWDFKVYVDFDIVHTLITNEK